LVIEYGQDGGASGRGDTVPGVRNINQKWTARGTYGNVAVGALHLDARVVVVARSTAFPGRRADQRPVVPGNGDRGVASQLRPDPCDWPICDMKVFDQADVPPSRVAVRSVDSASNKVKLTTLAPFASSLTIVTVDAAESLHELCTRR